MMKLDKIERKK